MTAPKPKKSAPTKLLWIEAALAVLVDHPNRQLLKALVLQLSQYGPSDGSKVNPSTRPTLMDALKASERSVVRGLEQLVEVGLLAVVKRYAHYPTWYRRTIPSAADEQYKSTSPADEQYKSTSPARTSPARTSPADEQYELLSPSETKEEEEERASAPVAEAPGAARLVKPSTNGVAEPLDPVVMEICRQISKHAGVVIKTEVLGPALADLLAERKWPPDAVAVYCVEKLKRLGRKAVVPSKLLAADVADIRGVIIPSPRMLLAAAFTKLDRLEANAAARRLVTDQLVEAGLIDDELPDAFSAKTIHLEQITKIVDDVVREFGGTGAPSPAAPAVRDEFDKEQFVDDVYAQVDAIFGDDPPDHVAEWMEAELEKFSLAVRRRGESYDDIGYVKRIGFRLIERATEQRDVFATQGAP